MNKEEFLKTTEKDISTLSKEDMEKFIMLLCERIPSTLHKTSLCIMKDIKGTLNEDDSSLKLSKQEICKSFKKIKDGTIGFKCYAYETGEYSYYEEELDYDYYPSGDLSDILDNTYNLIVSLIMHRKYSTAIELIDLILYTDYTCFEVNSLTYNTSDEIIDTFEIEIDRTADNLDFNLEELRLYGIYAVLASNYPNKKSKILKYSNNGKIDAENSLGKGLDKIDPQALKNILNT